LLKEKGKFKEQKGTYLRGKAIKLGAMLTKQRLASTFKIQPTKQTVSGMDIDYKPSKKEFREYKIVKGKQVPMENQWIELRGKRLTTRAEKGAFVTARRQKKGGMNWL